MFVLLPTIALVSRSIRSAGHIFAGFGIYEPPFYAGAFDPARIPRRS